MNRYSMALQNILYILAAILLVAGVVAFCLSKIMLSAGLCLCATCFFGVARRRAKDM